MAGTLQETFRTSNDVCHEIPTVPIRLEDEPTDALISPCICMFDAGGQDFR